MKIKINGKIYDIDDATHLEIEFNGDLDDLSVGSHGNSSVTIINGSVIQRSGSFSEPRSIEVKVAGNVNKARTISGDVKAAGPITGGVSTVSGDIRGVK